MDVPRPEISARLVDGVAVAVVAAVGVIGIAVSIGAAEAVEPTWRPLAVGLALVQAGVLWWRRDHPLLVLGVALAALVAAQAVGDLNAASYLGPHVAAYSVGAHGSRRDRFLSLPVMAAAAGLDGAVIRWVDGGPAGPVLLGFGGLLVLAAWGAGHYVDLRRTYIDTLLAHARQVEEDRDEQARQAVLEERRRIARELHDQVAHHLGVVSLQTAAAKRWLGRDAAVAADALDAAENAARDALTTMPVILEALRSDGEVDGGPQPSLADLDALVAQVSGAGVPVDVKVHGRGRPLDPKIELAAYRIIQEALTNALKHAGRARATVTLTYGPGRLDVAVDDDGHGAAATGGGTGHGLVGMRERVELLGGELSTGPRPGGGFQVRARLPATKTAERR